MEHILAHPVVLLQVFIHAVAVVRVFGVLAEGGTPKVQVAQAAAGGVALPGVGTHEVAQHGHVVAVERSADGQRVVLGIVALQVSYLAVLLHGRESELVGHLPHGGGGDMGHLAVVGIAHDVLGVVAPCRLVGIDAGSRHVDAQPVVLVKLVAAAQRGGCLASHDDGV